MTLSRNSNQVYIKRDIDTKIEEELLEKTSKVLFLEGGVGVGKTTLLKELFQNSSIPIIYIDISKLTNIDFSNILLDESVTLSKNCSNFEKTRKTILEQPTIIDAITSNETKNLSSETLLSENEDYGIVFRTIFDAINIGKKISQKKEEEKKKEIIYHTEFALLNYIKEDFQDKSSLFIVDNLEESQNEILQSKINFLETGDISKSLNVKEYTLTSYFEGLIYFFVKITHLIFTTKIEKEHLNIDFPLDYTKSLKLENFNFQEIEKFFSFYNQKNILKMPKRDTLKKIEALANSNPLLITTLFEYLKNNEIDFEIMRGAIFTNIDTELLDSKEKEVVKENLKDSNFFNKLGKIYEEEGEYFDAINNYEKAIKIDPKNSNSYLFLANIYEEKRELKEALNYYDLAILNKSKESHIAYNQIGLIKQYLGEFKYAINSYKKALEIDSTNSSIYLNLFEVQLLSNSSFDETLEESYYIQFKDDKESFIYYEMLKLFEAIYNNKKVNSEVWFEKYQNQSLNWDFNDIDIWVENIKEEEIKENLKRLLKKIKELI